MDPGLDGLAPATRPARDASHFRRIVAARKRLTEAEAELRDAVADAREAGDSWTVIAAALDTSRQAAQQRFSNKINPKDYVISSEATVSDIDLDTEEFIYQGKRLTEADAERLAEEVLRRRTLGKQHVTAVSTTFGHSHTYVGWCETCRRELGPGVADEISAREQIVAHEEAIAAGVIEAAEVRDGTTEAG